MEILTKKERKQLMKLLLKGMYRLGVRILNDIFALCYVLLFPLLIEAILVQMSFFVGEGSMLLLATIIIISLIFENYKMVRDGRIFLNARIGGTKEDKQLRYLVYRENNRRINRHNRLKRRGINEPYHLIKEADARYAQMAGIELSKL